MSLDFFTKPAEYQYAGSIESRECSQTMDSSERMQFAKVHDCNPFVRSRFGMMVMGGLLVLKESRIVERQAITDEGNELHTRRVRNDSFMIPLLTNNVAFNEGSRDVKKPSVNAIANANAIFVQQMHVTK